NLYSDRPGGIVWDNTTGVAATGNGNDQWYPIYGLVPAQTTPVAGTYRDTVNVTISW
ncbi:spore coat protein U, partial [Pseudomonas aeruginosa]